MSIWSGIGLGYDPVVRTQAIRPTAPRPADAPARDTAIEEARTAGSGERRSAAPLSRVALGAGASGVPGGGGAVTAQLSEQFEPDRVAYGRADTAYRQSAARLFEIMRASPPLDLQV